eukprot:2059685-Rhodomonas_salina.1
MFPPYSLRVPVGAWPGGFQPLLNNLKKGWADSTVAAVYGAPLSYDTGPYPHSRDLRDAETLSIVSSIVSPSLAVFQK